MTLEKRDDNNELCSVMERAKDLSAIYLFKRPRAQRNVLSSNPSTQIKAGIGLDRIGEGEENRREKGREGVKEGGGGVWSKVVDPDGTNTVGRCLVVGLGVRAAISKKMGGWIYGCMDECMRRRRRGKDS